MPALTPLATGTPACTTRAWMSAPHPRLPLLATACSDKTVRLYSLRDFRQQAVIAGGHKRSIRSCAWKPNAPGESVLATGSFDASAGLWRRDEAGGRPARAREREVDFTTGLAGGGADADADGSDDEDDEWKFAVVLDGHDSEIKCVSFAPAAPLLATCSRDKSVWIWEELDGENFETVAVLQEHEGDVKCVAWHPSEEVLASASYDDSVRLWREDVDDWACCAHLTGHAGTVWWVEFEGASNIYALGGQEGLRDAQKSYVEARLAAGPRLISCSDDRTIRVWRKVSGEKREAGRQGKVASIWKNRDFEERWVEEGRLPPVHERPVYSVSWSRKTGRVVSTGSDGKIVVYEERWRRAQDEKMEGVEEEKAAGRTPGPAVEVSARDTVDAEQGPAAPMTEWTVVAEVDNAHDVFEVNHVVWAPRADAGQRAADEEVVVSTGDDGEVRVWTFDP